MANAAPVSNGIDLESSLSAVAAEAAAELDDLLRDRTTTLHAVAQLREHLRHSIVHVDRSAPLALAFNPTAAVVVRRAFASDPSAPPPSEFAQLQEETKRLTEELDELSTKPSAESLGKLKTFCLNLSQQALGLNRSPIEGQEHPFRT